MKRLPRLPKKLYVRWLDPGRGEEPYLDVTDDPRNFADAGQCNKAAIYELVDRVLVTADVKVIRPR